MIELRSLVAVPGMKPISGSVAAGELVSVTGPNRAALAAFFEVLAGQRPAISGEVVRAPAARPGRGLVLIAASDAPLPGLDRGQWLRYYAAACGVRDPAAVERAVGEAGADDHALNIARGRVMKPALWLISTPREELSRRARNLMAAIRAEARAGAAIIVASAGEPEESDDRRWVIEGAIPRVGAAPICEPATATRPLWSVLVGLELLRATQQRKSLAFGVIGAGLMSLLLWVVAAHEGYWYPTGSIAGVALTAQLVAVAIGVAVGIASASAERLAATSLRETPLGVARFRRLELLGDLVPALAATLAAGPVAIWGLRAGALSPGYGLLLLLSPVLVAACAAIVRAALVRIQLPGLAAAVVAAVLAATLALVIGGSRLLW